MLYGDERGILFPYSLLTPSKLLVHYVVLVPEFFFVCIVWVKVLKINLELWGFGLLRV